MKKKRRKKKAAGTTRPAGRSAARRGKTPAHATQEGSVESVSERPTGAADEGDRSGEGTRPPGRRPQTEKGRDAFVSSEIGGRTSRPGKDPRTRS
jgi:hypothetical protein